MTFIELFLRQVEGLTTWQIVGYITIVFFFLKFAPNSLIKYLKITKKENNFCKWFIFGIFVIILSAVGSFLLKIKFGVS